MPAPNGISVEEELAFRLAGVASVRSAEADRIRHLAARADGQVLAGWLHEQRVLGALGSRLIETCPELVSDGLHRVVEATIAEARHRHTLMIDVTRRFWRLLEGAGIPAVAIKGGLLAERLYSDPALRSAPRDLDFLVPAAELDDAVVLFNELGYTVHDASIWADRLPHYHYSLHPGHPLLPKIELHWRVHWYEKEFARRLIARSVQEEDGVRVPCPTDDLAMLLIIFARDGFVGLRLATDIAAWWDAQAHQLPHHALDPVLDENPCLRSALLCALEVAQSLVGLPPKSLISARSAPARRTALAARLSNWRASGGWLEVATKITLIDLLLTPPSAVRVYLRHYYFQPLSKYARDYGWRPEARVRNETRRLAHALARVAKSLYKFSRLLWAIRSSAGCDAVPSRYAPRT